MNRIFRLFLTVPLLLSLCVGQFKTDVQQLDFPQELKNLSALESRSLLDPSRLTVNHSFSVSMLSMGGQSVSVGTYTNRMSFLLRDNLRLSTNFSLLKSSLLQTTDSPNILDGQIGFGAELEYRPTPHTLLQLGFQHYPDYLYYDRYWNPFYGLR